MLTSGPKISGSQETIDSSGSLTRVGLQIHGKSSPSSELRKDRTRNPMNRTSIVADVSGCWCFERTSRTRGQMHSTNKKNHKDIWHQSWGEILKSSNSAVTEESFNARIKKAYPREDADWLRLSTTAIPLGLLRIRHIVPHPNLSCNDVLVLVLTCLFRDGNHLGHIYFSHGVQKERQTI